MAVTSPSAATSAATTAATSAATSAASSTKPATAINADFQTFLKLLTTQMQNQDPLKPLDSTEFVAQLASFSAVEQQVQSNDKLDDILGALGGSSAGGLAAWIGREVRAASAAEFDGKPIEVATTPVNGADKATLLVTNAFGTVVAERSVDPKATEVTWDGTTNDGTTAASGSYTFKVRSYNGTNLVGTTDGAVYSKVAEVAIEDGVATLVTEGGTKVPLSNVTGVR